MSAPGLMLSNRYRLGRLIAVGGMGEVWSADDTRLRRVVAVKILRPELTGDAEFVERFRAEARITASLNHHGIAAVYDYGEVDAGGPHLGGTAYLVMELIAGESLSSVLARVGRLSPARTLDVLDQTGRALQEAHSRSLVHRDIKPGNLLITPGGQVKITDFGIAKVAHQVPVTRIGMVMGTAQYISPEQAAGQPAVPASDIYSLGVVAYECLAGTLPFTNENSVAMALAHVREAPRALPADVPPPVAALVMHMLVKDPAARFGNGSALAQAVGRVRSAAATAPRGPGTAARTRVEPAARQPAPAGLAAGYASATGAPKPAPRPTRVQPVVAPVRPVAGPMPPVSSGPRAPAPGYRPAQSGPPPNPGPARPAPSTAGRRTGLSVLLAVLVLLLAGLVLVVVNQLVGDLSAAPRSAPVPNAASAPSADDVRLVLG